MEAGFRLRLEGRKEKLCWSRSALVWDWDQALCVCLKVAVGSQELLQWSWPLREGILVWHGGETSPDGVLLPSPSPAGPGPRTSQGSRQRVPERGWLAAALARGVRVEERHPRGIFKHL